MNSGHGDDPLWYRIDGVLFALLGNVWVGLDHEGRPVRLDATYAGAISRIANDTDPEVQTSTGASSGAFSSVVLQSNLSSPMTSAPTAALIDEEIAKLARKYWEDEGQPDGRAEEHWHRAEQELKKG